MAPDHARQRLLPMTRLRAVQRDTRIAAMRVLGLLLCIAASCSVAPVPPVEPGARVRLLVTGRGQVTSTTSVEYQLWLTLKGRDGRPERVALNVPPSSDVLAIATDLAVRIGSIHDAPPPAVAPVQRGDAAIVEAEFQLPDDLALDGRSGCFYVYRFDRARQRKCAEVSPEIHVGVITRDGDLLIALVPDDGPELGLAGSPPGWSPAAR
jgi:hypothetical protein